MFGLVRIGRRFRLSGSAVGLLLAGCTASSPSQSPLERPAPIPDTLPAIQGDGDCGGVAPTSVGGLIWAGTADAVVVGDVADVVPLLEPAWLSSTAVDPRFISAGDCRGDIYNGLIIELRDVEYLRGSGPDVVRIVIGYKVVEQWSATPSYRDGKLDWGASSSAVAKGQRLGSAVWVDPEFGVTSPRGEPLFLVDAGQVVRFQAMHDECVNAAPSDIDAHSIDEVRSLLAGRLEVGSDAAVAVAERRRNMDAVPAISRMYSFLSATCMELDPGVSEGECTSDNDCAINQVCSAAACVPAP